MNILFPSKMIKIWPLFSKKVVVHILKSWLDKTLENPEIPSQIRFFKGKRN